MKPPFESSGGSEPTRTSETGKSASPGSGAPGGGGLPGGLPDGLTEGLPDDLSDLPSCLPGSCDALWNAVDKGMAPITDAVSSATKAAGDAKDKATEAVTAAKDKAVKAVDDAKQAVRQNVEMAKKYAELYQNDAKQAWAGVASVMSQQASCAAAKALDALAPGATDAARGKLGQYVDEAGRYVDKPVQMLDEAGRSVAEAGRSAEQTATGYAKDGMDTLAATKKSVFESVYPVTKFYEDNGLDKLTECGSIPGRPEVPAALGDALEQIDKGTDEGIRAGSDMIAQYEQNSVVETAIYEAERYRDEGMTELASAAEAMKSGLTDAIPMSSTCGGPPLPFDGSLLDPDARERYYHKLMNEFETMGKREKDKMIDDIAKQATP